MEEANILSVFNTFTQRYEDIPVSEAVYNEYKRVTWRAEKDEQRRAVWESLFSQLDSPDESTDNFHELIDESKNPESMLLQEFRKNSLERLLESIPEKYRRSFLLHFKYGMKVEDIGRQNGVSFATAKMEIEHAKKYLRKNLKM